MGRAYQVLPLSRDRQMSGPTIAHWLIQLTPGIKESAHYLLTCNRNRHQTVIVLVHLKPIIKWNPVTVIDDMLKNKSAVELPPRATFNFRGGEPTEALEYLTEHIADCLATGTIHLSDTQETWAAHFAAGIEMWKRSRS